MTRELVRGLQEAGHEPAVYSPRLGTLAREIAGRGVPVADDLGQLAGPPDVIHGHHHIPTVQAMLRFPTAPALFVCHDGQAATDVPPRLSGLRRYVAVDQNCRERLVRSGVPEARIRVVHNWVDLSRFAPRPALPARPQRALVFSNYAGPDTHLPAVRAACESLGLPLDVIGSGSGNPVERPEAVLGAYDLVFAKARCALEALAVGAAVVLCDAAGLGPMVTEAEMPWLRAWNFGQRLLREPLEPARIEREILRYDPADAQRASRYVRVAAGLPAALSDYVALYREILAEPAEDTSGDELARNLEALLVRLAELERGQGAIAVTGRMESLTESASERVCLSLESVPTSAARGQALSISVGIGNACLTTLTGGWPYPIRLSYRWLSPEGAVVVSEGSRTELVAPIPAGERAVCAVRVKPPDQAGSYVLRLTLVQELVRWFDQLPRPVYIDVPVSVD